MWKFSWRVFTVSKMTKYCTLFMWQGQYQRWLRVSLYIVCLLLSLTIEMGAGGCVPRFSDYSFFTPKPGEMLPIVVDCTVFPGEDFRSNFTSSLRKLVTPSSAPVLSKFRSDSDLESQPNTMPMYPLYPLLSSTFELKLRAERQKNAADRQHRLNLVREAPKWVQELKLCCTSSEDPCHIPGITAFTSILDKKHTNFNTTHSDMDKGAMKQQQQSLFLENDWNDWTRLEVLSVSHVTGGLFSRAFQGLDSLEELSLHGIRLTRLGDHSTRLFLKDLPSLQKLYLSGNGIVSIDLDTFEGHAPTLNWLSLAHNSLESFPMAIFRVHSLKVLRLDYNKNLETLALDTKLGSGNISRAVAPSLTELLLQDCQIWEISPDFFNSFPALEILDLSRNLLAVLRPDTFVATKSPKLIEINLSFNRLTTQGLSPFHNFRDLPNLQTLDLWQNNLTGNLNLPGLVPPQLQFLHLSNNKLTSLSMHCDPERTLTLSRNLSMPMSQEYKYKYNETCSSSLKLSYLRVNFNQLKELSPNSLPSHLQKLEVIGNVLELIHPWTFYHMGQLREVNFESNRLTTLTSKGLAIPLPLRPSPEERVGNYSVIKPPFFSIRWNPIICDRRVEWLAEALRKREEQLEKDDLNHYIHGYKHQLEPISSPAPQLYQVPELETCCGLSPFTREKSQVHCLVLNQGATKYESVPLVSLPPEIFSAINNQTANNVSLMFPYPYSVVYSQDVSNNYLD